MLNEKLQIMIDKETTKDGLNMKKLVTSMAFHSTQVITPKMNYIPMGQHTQMK
jgi:hypothetical protein